MLYGFEETLQVSRPGSLLSGFCAAAWRQAGPPAKLKCPARTRLRWSYVEKKLASPTLLCGGSPGATRLHHLTWQADKSPEGLQSHPQQCQVLVFGVALPLGGSFVTALQAQSRHGQCSECCVNNKSYILQIHDLC